MKSFGKGLNELKNLRSKISLIFNVFLNNLTKKASLFKNLEGISLQTSHLHVDYF